MKSISNKNPAGAGFFMSWDAALSWLLLVSLDKEVLKMAVD